METADHKQVNPGPIRTRRLILEIPETSPCYLTINQSEDCAQADHAPCDSLPHIVFQNPSLKAIGEFDSFKHELPVLLAWGPTINTILSFITAGCQQVGFAAHCRSRPKFSSETGTFSKLQSAHHIHGICTLRFNQPQIKIILKNPESSKKQDLNLPHTSNYLHSIYIIFTTIYIAFTLFQVL